MGTLEDPMCSSTLTAEIHHQLVYLSAVNIFLAIIAFIGSYLILFALHYALVTLSGNN